MTVMACNEDEPQGEVEQRSPGTWKQAQRILEVLASLSYTGDLDCYLRNIALGVSQLIELDWSVVTVCHSGQERVMASSLELGAGDHIYSLHGLLTETVVQTGKSLAIEDAKKHPEYGIPPEGYVSYLGVPLRTSKGEILGTICSFSSQPRQFSIDEVRTAELFAERAAAAIENYRLYQHLRQFNEQLEAEVVKRTEELKAAQDQLIEQERLAAVGQFAAMIVHEIRNPMTTIRMGLNYFKKRHLEDGEQERLALSLDEVVRLENLLNEILLYAKPQVLQFSEIDVNEFITALLPLLRDMPEAVDRNIVFIPMQPFLTIQADRDKLKQVMINVIKNACEAIDPEGVVTCSAELESRQKTVCIRIHNKGLLIPPDLLPKLTQPFCSNKPGGTGLGLAIVKRIVDAHGGSLQIESEEDKGTTVSVTIPTIAATSTSICST